MLIVVRYLVPGLFLFGIVGGQGLVKDFMRDLFQIFVAKGHILPRPAPVYIRSCKAPVVVPDTAPASHAGNSCTDKITHPFYRLNLLPIPSYHSPCKGARPLCYFLGEKVTQKHFHTAAPLGRQYESAFARSRGDCLGRLRTAIAASVAPEQGISPAAYGHSPRGHQFTAGPYFLILSRHLNIKFMLSRCYTAGCQALHICRATSEVSIVSIRRPRIRTIYTC